MICPKCKKTYLEERRYCNSCMVSLVDSLPVGKSTFPSSSTQSIPLKGETEINRFAPPILKKLGWFCIFLTILSGLMNLLNEFTSGENLIASIIATIISGVFEIFIFFKILSLKNWARRLYILLSIIILFAFGLPVLLSTGSWSSAAPIFTVIQHLFSILEYGVNFFLIVVLFQPKIRSFFTSQKPKTYQRIFLVLFVCLNALMGFQQVILTKWFKGEANHSPLTEQGYQHFYQKGAPLKEKAEKATGIKLPDWGLVADQRHEAEFDVLSLTDVFTQHSIVLWITSTKNPASFDRMLKAMEPTALKIISEETLTLSSGTVPVKRVWKQNKTDQQFKAEVEIAGKRIIVLTFTYPGMGKQLDKSILEAFLNDLLKKNQAASGDRSESN